MNIPLFSVLLTAAVLSGCAGTATRTVQPRMDLLGMPVIDDSAMLSHHRTVVIDAGTRWVNVDSGEVIHFVVGDKHFAWNFQVNPSVATFDLRLVAPPGTLARTIPVYVAPNPIFGTGA